MERDFSNGLIDLIETTQLGDKFLVTSKDPMTSLRTRMYYSSETHNVNIAIASAVTSYLYLLI